MKDKIDRLYPKIAAKIKRTPLVLNEALGKIAHCTLHLKLENQQITGSFKLRGALSKFLVLNETRGNLTEVVAASTGNHAAGVCYAAQLYQCTPTLFVPHSISPDKLTKLHKTTAHVKIAGAHSGESEQLAAMWSQEHQVPLIHPYNDLDVIAGQGTIAKEIMESGTDMDMAFVPVGGGGLISGIAAYLKSWRPEIQVIGVQPVNASEMADSIRAQQIVPPSEKSTISDGTAGGLDPETVTFDFCKRYVDRFVLVSEEEIVAAMHLQELHAGLIVEPAGALALAGILHPNSGVAGKNVVAIVCGGNIHPDQFRKIVDHK